jgi:clan AA aspartic protease
VKGFVDEQSRALVKLKVGNKLEGIRTEITDWVDTAFNGGLVIPKHIVSELQLAKESSAEAALADGSLVELETFACFFDWFGKSYETQIVANEGQYALLGTMLLNGHRLIIDYNDQTVELT